MRKGVRGEMYTTTTILRTINLVSSYPSFLETLFYEGAEIFVELVTGTILSIETLFEFLAGSTESS